VAGTTTLAASSGSAAAGVALNNATNNFVGGVSATGNNITLNDVNSLTLGTVTTAGNLNAKAATNLAVNGVVSASTADLTATTGNITQGTNSRLTVTTGPTNLTAGGSMTLQGTNNFAGVVNKTGIDITTYVTESQGATSKLLANTPASPMLGTSLSNTNLPQPLMVSATTQTLVTKDLSSSANRSTASSQASGIIVEQRNAPSSTVFSTIFAVSLPKGTSTMGAGFSFELSETVRALAQQEGQTTQPQALLPTGAPLPSWLKFDPERLRFDASAVPDGAFPLQVVITVAGQRVVVVISERTE
jgi:hypothetical protein